MKPIPIKAVRPLSSFKRITKYLAESDTLSTATLGYASTGQAANNSPLNLNLLTITIYYFCFIILPVFLSSSLITHFAPCATIRILPLQSGASNFQSAALLKKYLLIKVTNNFFSG